MDTDPVIENKTRQLIDNPDNLAVFLFGSRARGNFRTDSDYDLVVIRKEGVARGIETTDGVNFEMVYTTEKDGIEYWRSHPDDAYGLWTVAKLLFDRDGTGKRVEQAGKEIVARGKKPVDDNAREHFKFDVEDQLRVVREITDTDPVTANLLLNKQVHHLIELYFDLRGLWTPAPKQILAELRTYEPDLVRLLEDVYRKDSSLESRLKGLDLIKSIVFRIEN